MLSPPVRRRCCVQRSRRRCTAPRCRLRTRKPLGSCGSRERRARTRSIVATCTRPGSARPDHKPCAANARPTDPIQLRLMPRFRPRFWATRTPGRSTVPRAVRVIARTSRASMRIVSKRRAMSVVAFSTQSLRRSRSRAFSFAIASFVRARRCEPRSARASRCCSTLIRLASPRAQARGVQQFTGRQAADTTTPRSIPTTPPVTRARDRIRDVSERDMPAAGPITGDPVGLHILLEPAATGGSAPSRLWAPTPDPVGG